MRRFLWGTVPLLAGCIGSQTAGALAEPPAFEPVGQTKCSVAASQRQPLVVEWPSSDRAALEALAKKGTVLVRYSGCEMELLPQCHAPGGYGFTPTTLKRDHVVIRDQDELYASVPLGAPKLEATLERAGTLDVDMRVVGRFDLDRRTVPASDLDGMCQRATHVVTGLTTGAFVFSAGASAGVGAEVGIGDAGGGIRGSAEKSILGQDGDAAACEDATGESDAPPAGCSAILRIEVAPVGASEGAPTAVAKTPAPAGVPSPTAGGVRAGPGVVKVHLTGNATGLELHGSGVQLLEPWGDSFRSLGESRILCRAPCDTWLDARQGQIMTIRSADGPPSDPFVLYQQEGEVEIETEVGSGGALIAGGIFSALGVLGVAAGIPTLIVGAAGGSSEDSNDDITTAGAIVTGVSGAFLVGGIVLTTLFDTEIEIKPIVGP